MAEVNDRLKSDFIATASHELRTPLTSVQMGVHLLLERAVGELTEKQVEVLSACREDCERLDKLMRDLLDLSRIEADESKPTSESIRTRDLIVGATRELRPQVESKGLDFKVEAPVDLPPVKVDRMQVERVLSNLVVNALRYTKHGEIKISVQQHGNAVAVSVSDTGSGIQQEYLPHIFDKFVQVPGVAAGGAGLGLAISRLIVEAHGGQISVHSEPSKGSTFTLRCRLPRDALECGDFSPLWSAAAWRRFVIDGARSGQKRRQAAALQKGGTLMKARILVIDDEDHIRRMMRLTLEAAGYEVGEAQDGSEGLRVYGDGSRWDAVVLDQRMPGMDGLETVRRIKTQNAGARVVMATAYASIELAVDAMKLGATDFVRKPTTPRVLRNAVSAALSRPAERDSIKTVPPIQTITMNGFTIVDDVETPMLDALQRRFIVVSPEGQRHDVLVQIETEPVEYVERMTSRRLPPDSSFWTAQARRVLSDFLWNERGVPPMKRLVLRHLDPDKLPVAARWKTEEAKVN